MKKKILMGLGSFMTVVIPLTVATSCGNPNKININKIEPIIRKNVKMKSGENDFFKTPKHFFYIKVDSLTSSRLLDSYNYLKEDSEEYEDEINSASTTTDKQKYQTLKDKIDSKISSLDDFNLKMNVISPDYGTSVGLGAMLGGANNAGFVQELRRKENVSRKTMMQSAWNTLIEDVASQENIKKIYLASSEYYEVDPANNYGPGEINTKEDLHVSKKAKSKIVLDHFKIHHDYYKQENFYKILDDYGNDIKKESNFTYINTLNIHDNFKYWTYDDYTPPSGRKIDFFETLLTFKNKLKKLGIYNSSEIMIVSDHGKQMNNYASLNKADVEDELQKEYFNFDYKRYSLDSINDNLKKESDFKKTNKDLFYSKSPIVYMTSILHKPFNNNDGPLSIDWKNLYYSADGVSQLYYNMYIPTKNLQFYFTDFMPSIRNNENKDGSYDSFVNNPFNKDLSKRVLFSLRKNVAWGLRKSLYLSNMGFIWNGPFWFQDKNQKWKLKEDSIIEFILDNKKMGHSPWLNDLIIKELKNHDNAYWILGKILDKIPEVINH